MNEEGKIEQQLEQLQKEIENQEIVDRVCAVIAFIIAIMNLIIFISMR